MRGHSQEPRTEAKPLLGQGGFFTLQEGTCNVPQPFGWPGVERSFQLKRLVPKLLPLHHHAAGDTCVNHLGLLLKGRDRLGKSGVTPECLYF